MKKHWVPWMLVLLLSYLLALAFQDFLREAIIMPILYAYWFVRLYIESFPQSLLWAIFIGVAIVIVGRGFFKREKTRRARHGVPMEHRQKIEAWAERIRLARRGNYFKLRLARRLAEISLEVLAYRERLAPDKIRRRLESGILRIPEDIQAYLQAGLAMDARPTLSQRGQHAPWARKTSPLQLNPERLVQFLEDLLRGLLQSRRSAHER